MPEFDGTQGTELRQDMATEQELRRLGEMAVNNFNSVIDSHSRILTESTKLRIMVDGMNFKVELPE